ncbi:MAG: SDR family NAD(P)-dependent oxidoreductase [Streptosporangiaceae bacterium]
MSQVAVLTGGTGRVGAIFLDQLVAAGWRVITVGRGRASAASWRHISWDLAADPPPEAADLLGQDIGLLILCAGVECQETATSLQAEHFRTVMQVNCGGHLSLLREVAKGHRGQWRVVAVSSDVVSGASPASLVYSASKAALEVGVRDAVADCRADCDAVILRLPYLGWPMSSRIGEPGPAELGPPLRPESLVRLIQSCLAAPFLAGDTRLVAGSPS